MKTKWLPGSRFWNSCAVQLALVLLGPEVRQKCSSLPLAVNANSLKLSDYVPPHIVERLKVNGLRLPRLASHAIWISITATLALTSTRCGSKSWTGFCWLCFCLFSDNTGFGSPSQASKFRFVEFPLLSQHNDAATVHFGFWVPPPQRSVGDNPMWECVGGWENNALLCRCRKGEA